MTRITKILLPVIFIVFLFGFFHLYFQTGVVGAEEIKEYQLLAPLTQEQAQNPKVELGDYLSTLFKIFLAVAGILATVMIVFAGFQYMLTELPGGKKDALGKFQNAILGLLLALSSYLILNTINPDLVNTSFTLEPVDIEVPVASTTPTGNVPPGSEEEAELFKKMLADEDSARSKLLASQIRINKSACTKLGQKSCTNVGLLNVSQVISQISKLQSECKKLSGSNCSVIINGGTEWWNHGNESIELSSNTTAHRPPNSVVDIAKDSNINKTITTKGKKLGPGGCSNLGPRYEFNGKVYVDEDSHWHACL